MADLWPDILHEASLGGITFPVARRRLRGGRAFASRQYPYRDGQTVEDTGREPYAFSLDVPLFASVDPSHYPDTADALRLLLEDGEDLGEVEYVDPFLGPLRVKLAGYDEDMDAQRRDGVTVRLDLEEIDPVEGGLFRVLANPDAESEARSAAADADDALSGAGLSEEDVSAILDAAGVPREAGAADAAASEGGAVGGLTSNALDSLRDGQLAVDEIAARVDRFRGQVRALRAYPDLPWEAAEALERAAAHVSDAGEAMIGSRHVAEWTLPAPLSAWSIAAAMLGDGGRAADVMRANPSANPLRYPAGTLIRLALG